MIYIPRTNNAVEGWHRAFLQQVSSHHPTIWKFLDALKREQDLQEITIVKVNSGCQNSKNVKKYRKVTKRVKKLVESFNNYASVVDYLRAIAYNLKV